MKKLACLLMLSVLMLGCVEMRPVGPIVGPEGLYPLPYDGKATTSTSAPKQPVRPVPVERVSEEEITEDNAYEKLQALMVEVNVPAKK